MVLALTLALIALLLRFVPQLLIWSVALLIGTLLVRRSRQVGRQLLLARCDLANFDRTPSRAERRLMRKHLQLALDQTELASLLPGVMTCARTLADR